MAHFTSLLNELLLQILDYVQSYAESQTTLSSLSRACRFLTDIAQDYLYHSPQASWHEDRDIWLFTIMLIRTLKDNTTLRCKVRVLSFHIPLQPVSTKSGHPNYLALAVQVRKLGGLKVYCPLFILEPGLYKFELATWIRALLTLVPCLESLELSTDAPKFRTWWGDIPKSSLAMLQNLFKELPKHLSQDFNFQRLGLMEQVHTLKLFNITPEVSLKTLPNLRSLELDAKFDCPELPDNASLRITRLTVHFSTELFFWWINGPRVL